MASIPTVMVEHPYDRNRFMTINESDFDPKRHKLWDAEIPATAEPRSVHASVGEGTPIPADWQDMKWFALRALAAKFTKAPIDGRDAAVAVIEAELARRA